MIKKYSAYFIIVSVIIPVIAFNFMFVSTSDSTTVLNINLNTKKKAEVFIDNQLFENITGDKIPDKYTNLSKETVTNFLKLKEGVEFVEKKQFQNAWQVWNNCLSDAMFNDYLAEAYFIIGNTLGARDGKTSLVLLQKALEISRSSKNRVLEYSCLNKTIQLLVSNADDDILDQESDKMAKQYSLEAKQLLCDSTFQYWERNASNSIYRIASESMYWLGEDSLANTYVDCLLNQSQGYDHPELAESYANIMHGVRTYISGEYKASEAYFKSAILKIGNATSFLNYDLELPYAYLGSIYIEQKRFDEAIDFMEKSIKTLQQDYYTNVEEPLKLIPSEAMSGQANTYNIILCYLRLQHFYDNAINTNTSSIKLAQLIELSAYTNQLIKSWFLHSADEETLLRATKLIKTSNSFVVDLIWNRQNKFENAVDRIFKLETEASSFYLNYIIGLRKHKNEESNFEKIRELTFELINAEMFSKHLEQNFIQKRLTLLKLKSELWDEKQSQLKKLVYNEYLPSNLAVNEAVIKYYISHSNLYVTYYSAQKKGVKLLGKYNFENRLKQFKRAVKSETEIKEEQHFFYNLLIKPLKTELLGINTLTILPDEMLDGITFELLLNDKNEFLVNDFSIKYAYSAKNICQKALPEINNILAFAPGFEDHNIYKEETVLRSILDSNSVISSDNMHRSLSPISFSINEVEGIGKLFDDMNINSTICTSKKATKTNLIKQIANQNIVHIATHGVSKNEYESGLFFTISDNDNGFLSLQELYQLDINTDLVVLSACKTATGEIKEGEGIMALPRGFICAGAKNIIASLWKVHDEKTKDLMVTFYKHLLEDKVSYAEALRLAKLDCIAKGFLPMDWAGFVLIGN